MSEESKEFCRRMLPADLMAKIEASCPNADWDKIFALFQSYGTIVAQAYQALNLGDKS